MVPRQASTPIGLRPPAEATIQPTSILPSQTGSPSQASLLRASFHHGPPPFHTQVSQFPTTANVPRSRIRQSQHDHRLIPQGGQSPIVNTGSPVQTQPQTLSQQPGSVNSWLPSKLPPLPGHARLPRTDVPNQSQSPVQISAISPNATSGSTPFSPIRIPDQAQSPPSAETVSFPPPSEQTHMPPYASGEPAAPSNIHRRQRYPAPNLTALKSRIALIRAHIDSVGGTQNLNNSLERPRFQLLTDACEIHDIFYVAVHQIFCVWDYDQKQLLGISGLPTRDVLTVAFSFLGQLIRHNDGMAPNHLRWFAGFPGQLDILWASSEDYQRVVADVGIFLSSLASKWPAFTKQCLARQYPPLVDELVNTHGILSGILQGVVFTATRRNLGLTDGQFGQMAEKIFSEDKRGFQDLCARYNTHYPPTTEENIQRNQALATRYYALLNHQPQQPQPGTQAPVVGSPPARRPIAISNTRLNQYIANLGAGRPSVQFSSNMDRVSRNANSQGQDPRVIQRSRPVAATTAEQPNPPPVARSPTAPGQAPYTGVSSPTPFQNLAILPPVVSSASPSSVTPSPIIQSQGQQALQRSHLVLGNNSVQTQQHYGLPGHSSVGQDRTTTPVSRSDLTAGDRSGLHLTKLQRQHIGVVQQQRQQQHATPQDQYQAIRVPNTQVRQRQFPSQMQPIAAHQASSANRDAQSRSSSHTHPRSHSQSNGSGRVGGVSATQPQASAVHSFLSPQDISKDQIRAYNNIQPPIMRPLVPPLGYTHPIEASNPDLTALHQAHVRSPVLAPTYLLGGKIPGPGHKYPKFYQSVMRLALEPSIIPATACISKFTFTVNEPELSLKAKDKIGSGSYHVARGYERGTLQFRLRCVQSKQDATAYSIAEWVITDTTWPETVFILVNGQAMEIRRKSHHAKDLPVDITSYILPASSGEGSTNQIRISTPRSSKYNDLRTFFVAVEVVEILDHPQIIDKCHQQRIPASQTLNAIKNSLTGPTSDEDDEITMVVSDLSIGLADPFTARIFDSPVRGSSCLHRECFDLETFLTTRKSKFVGQPSLVDVWKCPLCGADARPYALQIDNFFVDVRAKLADDNNLGVKAIWISANGSWKPKSEAPLKRKADTRPDDVEEEEGPAAKQRILDRAAASRAASIEAGQANRSANWAVEVIELDDD